MSERTPLEPTVDHALPGDGLDAGSIVPEPDNDPQPRVLQALSASLPSVPRILLREPESFGGSPIVRPSSEEMPSQQDPKARLQLHGEIARGGMGAVLKGRDVDLGRDVAVKVLLETHHDKAEMIQRFIEEAQISGQLQHPGIAPLYELGRLTDSRPYFTMKLVKGKTLATLLAARKTADEERARFLGIFVQVCQTLAYAHARGVIHRDLKPSNIMVGAFGEVQVMDWGLAKVLKEGGIADEHKARERADVSVIRTQRSEGSSTPEIGSHTQAGTVLGTPAYMAPEQARGEVDLVDERADVFGLGAISCEILTGKPPYVGKAAEIAYKARAAKLDDAFGRLDACGADAELIALTRRCLAAELWERPRDAGGVTEQVTNYQNSVAERLRQAELAKAAEEARAIEARATAVQERRARRMTLALAATVLLAMTLVGGGGLWYQRQVSEQREEEARREGQLRAAVVVALKNAMSLRQRERWAEAWAVLQQVRQLLGPSGPEDLCRQVAQAEADLLLVARLEAARLNASSWVGGNFDYASTAREYAAAFRESGIGEETEAAEVVAARIRASAVWGTLVAAVDDWVLRMRKEEPARIAWLLAVARAADRGPNPMLPPSQDPNPMLPPSPWRDRFRDAAAWQDPSALERLAREAKVSELSPQILDTLGVLLYSRDADAVPLLTTAQRRYPSDFWLNFDLGYALCKAKRWGDAISYYRVALALRPGTIAVHYTLANALFDEGRVEEAITQWKNASELHFALPRVINPAHAEWQPIAKRDAFLNGKYQPRDNAERLHLAQLCYCTKYNRAAAQLYADAFAAEPERAGDLKAGYRYKAGCAAALALAGGGKGDAEDAWRFLFSEYAHSLGAAYFFPQQLDDKERSRLHKQALDWQRAYLALLKQALDWLRADLTAYGKLVDDNKPQDRTLVQQRLQHWQHDTDLSGLRDKDTVAQLPSDERQACEKLWADVAALLKKAEQKK